ncbi:MAG: response regulator [Candidatus Abyssobacteria bacterium SURF_5]|uniref:Response regulator n=1 Tax=Abyssobacteria bacterium (strain SURF_5) TaxID=2093360 RepID=A0A3A4NP41_ABYX5|nr:MAG: response regulator [Candidatus Abyssubacteria bacterium SURF_5]
MLGIETIHVLIVDDEERFRANTATILRKRGFSVTAVGSGIEAIEEIKKNQYHVVVLDIKMPGMDGHEALREIKRIKPDLEVIMLTGHGTPESAFTGLREGVFDYLGKPCDIDLLSRKIRSAYAKERGVVKEEARVKDVMVPLSSFSTVHEDCTVGEAIEIILRSFQAAISTATIHESVHRSTLILDDRDRVIGVLSFTDILEGLQPEYMRMAKNQRPMMADTVSQFLEAPNYSGIFTVMARDLAKKKVRDLMSEAPPTIEGDDNLMAAASKILALKVRRLLVTEQGRPIGVIREQDLIFEIANIIRGTRPPR